MTSVKTQTESLNCVLPNVISCLGNKATTILQDRRDDGNQWVYRYIQNLSGGDLYVAFDITCQLVAEGGNDGYHFILSDRQQLMVPTTGFVSVLSVAGGKVSGVEFSRPRM